MNQDKCEIASGKPSEAQAVDRIQHPIVGLWYRFRFWLLGGAHSLPDGGVNGQPPLWERVDSRICKWLDDREARKCWRCSGFGRISLDIAGCTSAECPDCKGRGRLTQGQMDAIALVKAHPLPAKLWTPQDQPNPKAHDLRSNIVEPVVGSLNL
jgi:hypothetical protein